jgi:hypothetical protein
MKAVVQKHSEETPRTKAANEAEDLLKNNWNRHHAHADYVSALRE